MATVRYFAAAAEAAGTESERVAADDLGSLKARLVDLHGHSVLEAAQILDVPEGTVKSRCARGRARLAISLGYLRNPNPSADVQPGRTTQEGAS